MKYKRIVVLTGAGISAESGIKTFRASDGLWENHRVEDVASYSGFLKNPNLVQKFYNERRRKLNSTEVKPNLAHTSLGEFEKKFQGKFLLVTQNIDNLHELGGSIKIIHMHGELYKIQCIKTNKIYNWKNDLFTNSICECCNQSRNLRPHIVWFGEIPLQMDKIETALSKCDLFISIGTSGNVYPAAGFVELANYHQAHTVELNLDKSQKSSKFRESYYGLAGSIVPKYLNSLY